MVYRNQKLRSENVCLFLFLSLGFCSQALLYQLCVWREREREEVEWETVQRGSVWFNTTKRERRKEKVLICRREEKRRRDWDHDHWVENVGTTFL
jgi:hypothetical protein